MAVSITHLIDSKNMTFSLKFSWASACSATLLAVTVNPGLKANAQVVAQQPGSAYPSAVVQQFVSSCASSAIGSGIPENLAQNSCECMIGELQKRYTVEEFVRLPQQMREDEQAIATLETIAKSCAPTLQGN